MNDEQLLTELKKSIQQDDAKTSSFFELAKMSGQDPKTDFSGANLSGQDLCGEDLRGANLQNTRLIEANLTKADLSEANLSGANLSFANLTGANLRGANLRDAILENARFVDNKELSESMKFYLLERGAIFKSSAPEYDINIKAYEDMIAEMDKKLLKNYVGKYVAFVDGRFVDSNANKDDLTKKVRLKHPNQYIFIKKVDDKKEEEIIDIRN